ncbi:MAG: aminoacyl-tRNA hydrolase [bacterium]|nr:aminoacyl-tRNA hydrolase [bacterium]
MISGEFQILLVAGLGNPGNKYACSWHNLGFLALDFWANEQGLSFKPGRGEFYHLSRRTRNGILTLIKPTSYMNLSGVPVRQVMKAQGLFPENILIICDDIALPFGTIRIRTQGSDGGHKGLASVITEIGTESFPRMRLGILTEQRGEDLADHVLSKIPEELNDGLLKILKDTSQALDCIFHRGLTAAMNEYNRNSFEAEPVSDPRSKCRNKKDDK